MITLSLSEIAQQFSVCQPVADASFTGISIDSRTLVPGNLFVAIAGPNFDGHDYLAAAIERGAVGAIVNHAPDHCPIPCIAVADTTLALGRIANYWRTRFACRLLAVTGSNGKTSTRRLLASILECACNDPSKVLATKGNLNNAYGVPLTLFAMNAEHDYAVIEMGMNQMGEIDYLSKMAQPEVAVITNITPVHLSGLGSMENIAKAKGEIFHGLTADGYAVINWDSPYREHWLHHLPTQHIMRFGLSLEADVRATVISSDHFSIQFTLHYGEQSCDVNLPLPGQHNMLNALAASAAAIAVGIPLTTIATGLAAVTPEKRRLETVFVDNDLRVIDDAYNASPASVKAAASVLAQMPGQRVLVLADMLELGDDAVALHREVGDDIATLGIDQIYTYGTLAAEVSAVIGAQAQHFNEQAALIAQLKTICQPHTTILIKGSNGMKMINVVNKLLEFLQPGDQQHD